MTETVFLLAGQGTQKLGMAGGLYEKYPIIRETFEQAGSILGYDTCELIDNRGDRLGQTRYIQPTVLTTSVIVFRLLQEKGCRPDMVAGSPLDEYPALMASGALSLKDAVALVAKCNEFMETAAPAGTGRMVAVMNTEASLTEEICQKASSKGIVTPASCNIPTQTVIGGEIEAVNYAVELLRETGVKRLIPLKVPRPFRTVLLQSVSERSTKVPDRVTPPEFQIPLTDNTEVKVMNRANIKALLARQVKGPVRFYDSIETMRELGTTEVIEVSPDKVLSGFLRKIDKAILASAVKDEASLEVLLEK